MLLVATLTRGVVEGRDDWGVYHRLLSVRLLLEHNNSLPKLL